MKRVFISVPMNSRPIEDIRKDIDEMSEYLYNKIEDIEIVDSLLTQEPQRDYSEPRLYYLGHALVKMAECDIVAFAKGYRNSKGCRVEEQAAIEYGLNRLYLDIPDYEEDL